VACHLGDNASDYDHRRQLSIELTHARLDIDLVAEQRAIWSERDPRVVSEVDALPRVQTARIGAIGRNVSDPCQITPTNNYQRRRRHPRQTACFLGSDRH
jgi:hypothetical protein